MKLLKPFIVFALILLGCQLMAQSSIDLIPYKSGKLWGYVNNKNVLKIPCIYAEADFFSDNGYAKIGYLKEGDYQTSYGFINTKGERVLTNYDFVYNFYNGLAIVGNNYNLISGGGTTKMLKMGAIDTSGKEIIYSVYRDLKWINKDYLVAEDDSSNYLIFDKKGEIVLYANKNMPTFFNGRYAIVRTGGRFSSIEDCLFGVVDNFNGENNFGTFSIPLSAKKYYNAINGNYISYSDYSKKDNGAVGLMDVNGKIIIDPWKYESNLANDYYVSEGYCDVKKKITDSTYLYGFVDSVGKLVIPLMYEQITIFNDGVALAKLKGKYGLINKQNEVVMPFKYDSLSYFSEGKAIFKQNGKMGFISNKGVEIIPAKYDYADHFYDGVAIVANNNKFGVIDTTGNVIVDLKYNEIEPFVNGYSRVKLTNKYGVINKKGTLVLPFKYDKKSMEDNYISDTSEYKTTDVLICNFNENGFALLQSIVPEKYSNYVVSMGYVDKNGREYFDDGVNLKAKKIRENYSITEAVREFNYEGIKEIVENGVDLNKKYTFKIKGTNYWGKEEYPVDFLLQYYNINGYNIFKLFVDNGLDVNLKINGNPLLNIVIEHENLKEQRLQMIKLLIEKNVQINAVDNINRNSIYCISDVFSYGPRDCSEDVEIAKLLLEHGADPTIKESYKNKTALKAAKKYYCKDLINLLKTYDK